MSPPSSTDPYVQTVINAAFAYKQKTLYPFQPARATAKALDFASAPSLKGWPLPFDLLLRLRLILRLWRWLLLHRLLRPIHLPLAFKRARPVHLRLLRLHLLLLLGQLHRG